jgi:hypothetical protein
MCAGYLRPTPTRYWPPLGRIDPRRIGSRQTQQHQSSSRQTIRRTVLISASLLTRITCRSRAHGFCVAACMYSFLPHRSQLILLPTKSASMSPKISFRSLGKYHRLTLHSPQRTSTSCPVSWALLSFHSPPRFRLPPVSGMTQNRNSFLSRSIHS